MGFTDTVLRHAPWSVSKCGVLEKCLLQYHKKHVQRRKEQGDSTESRVGVAVHYVTELVTKTDTLPTEEMIVEAGVRGKLTQDEHDTVRSFVPKVAKFSVWLREFIHKHGVTDTLVEDKMAINMLFEKAPFMPTRPWREGELEELAKQDKYPRNPANGAGLVGEELTQAVRDGTAPLMRGVLDLGLLTKHNDLVIIDHKTGKHKPLGEHAAQLNVYRLFGVAHYPVRAVQCAIHYVESGRIDWTEPMAAERVRRELQPWLEVYLNKQHHRLQLVDSPTPPNPETGWQCSFCGYVSECPEGRAEAVLRAERKKSKGQTPGGVSV